MTDYATMAFYEKYFCVLMSPPHTPHLRRKSKRKKHFKDSSADLPPPEKHKKV